MQKPRTHEIETLSDAYLQKILSEWVCNKLSNDYGIDFHVTIVSETKITGKTFYVQNKGTDNIEILQDQVLYSMETRHLKHYLLSPIPVYLIRYDAQNECAYWQNLQKYIILELKKKTPSWDTQLTVTIRIPLIQKLEYVENLKQDVIETTDFLFRNFVSQFPALKGLDPFLNDILEMEKTINKINSDSEVLKLHLSELYFKNNNLELIKKNLQDIINSSSITLEKLIAISGALSLCSFYDDDDEVIRLSDKGISVANSLNNSDFFHYFECHRLLLSYKNLNKEFLPQLAYELKMEDKDPDDIEFRAYQKIFTSVLKNKIDNIYDQIIEKSKILRVASSYELYFVIILRLVNLNAMFNYALLMVIPNKAIILDEMNQKETYLNLLLEILRKLSNEDLVLYGLLQIGGYFEICNFNAGLLIYQEGLKKAESINHQFYKKKFNELIANSAQFKESFENVNLPEIDFNHFLEVIKTEAMKILEIDSTYPYRDKLNQAIRDLDPSQYMKKCKNLQIDYLPTPYGIMIHNHAFGKKLVGCQFADTVLKSTDLVKLYVKFSEKYCQNCIRIDPRPKQWSCSIQEMKNMHDFFMQSI